MQCKCRIALPNQTYEKKQRFSIPILELFYVKWHPSGDPFGLNFHQQIVPANIGLHVIYRCIAKTPVAD